MNPKKMEFTWLLRLISLIAIVNILETKPVVHRRIRKPWENKKMFEGDMILNRNMGKASFRNAVPEDSELWPGGIIYYGIAPTLNSHRDLILSAMHHIESHTCLRFEENTHKSSYVTLLDDTHCYSHVGRSGAPQALSLGKNCMNFGTVVHELLHTVGFYHEHTRSDRDDYIEINWDHIDPEFDDQFTKMSSSDNRLINNFDYDSIMMYGNLAFSVDGTSETMKPKKKGVKLTEVEDKKGLSNSDIQRINKLYKCSSNNVLNLFMYNRQ